MHRKKLLISLCSIFTLFALTLIQITLPRSQIFHTDALRMSPGVYYGVYADSWQGVLDFEKDARKPVSIVMQFHNWTEGNFPTDYITMVRNHGAIPMISWESYDEANPDSTAWKNIANGNFDAYIKQWAVDSRNWGHPYFLRFNWEMNGLWSPYAKSAADFVPMWKHVHDIFTQNGAANVTWVWCPNIEGDGTHSIEQFYPGDNYVNWTCMDGYNFGTTQSWSSWASFLQLFSQTYNHLLRLAPNKPMMIAETASAEQDGSKADWVKDMLQYQLPHNFPNIKAFVWFNLNKETDWRIESSQAALQAFASGISSPYYASYFYANLNQTPIPPLGSLSSRPAPITLQTTSMTTPGPSIAPTPIKELVKISVSQCHNTLVCLFNPKRLIITIGVLLVIISLFISWLYWRLTKKNKKLSRSRKK